MLAQKAAGGQRGQIVAICRHVCGPIMGEKADTMSTLVVLKFDSEDGAATMRDRLLKLQKRQLITIEDAAIMKKDANGKPKLEQLNNMAGVGALGGAFWGMLF
jgi:uncharacterized membrane protein